MLPGAFLDPLVSCGRGRTPPHYFPPLGTLKPIHTSRVYGRTDGCLKKDNRVYS